MLTKKIIPKLNRQKWFQLILFTAFPNKKYMFGKNQDFTNSFVKKSTDRKSSVGIIRKHNILRSHSTEGSQAIVYGRTSCGALRHFENFIFTRAALVSLEGSLLFWYSYFDIRFSFSYL